MNLANNVSIVFGLVSWLCGWWESAYKTNNAWWLQEGSIPSVVLFSEPCSVDGIHLWVAWGTCPQFKKKKRVGLATVEVVAPSGVALVGSTDGKKRWLALNFDNKEDLTNWKQRLMTYGKVWFLSLLWKRRRTWRRRTCRRRFLSQSRLLELKIKKKRKKELPTIYQI